MNTLNLISSRKYQQIILILIGSFCAIGYGYLAVKSNDNSGIQLFDFLGVYWGIGIALFLYWIYLHLNDFSISYKAVIFWAVIFRIIGTTGSPILEDDFYRYLLDGCLFLTNGSPYGITPESLFQSNNLPNACQAPLTWVNNSGLPTIYGPLLQYVFAFAYIISPANIGILQFILVLFDIGIILILCRLTSAKNILIYAWNPLVIKEIAFTAHPDVIGIFFVMAAFTARHYKYTTVAALSIAFACASKIFALLLLPYIIYKQPFKYWLLILFTIALLYLPFIINGPSELSVLGIFAEHWQFNATLFQLFSSLFNDEIARITCLGLFAVWWCYYFKGFYSTNTLAQATVEFPRGDWIFGIFLLLSPVANPWYLIWLLPFAVLRPSAWACTATLAVSLTYITGLHLQNSELNAYQIANWAVALEVIAIGAAIYFDYTGNNRSY